jgi:hypothetical protein
MKDDKMIKMLATAAGVAAATAAQGDIVYTDVEDAIVSAGNGSLYVDIEGKTALNTSGSSDDLQFYFVENSPGQTEKPHLSGQNEASAASYSSYITFISKIPADVSIGSSLSYQTEGYLEDYGNGDWTEDGTGYIGFKLGSGNYGWAQLTYNDTDGSMTIHDFAYENSGSAIVAGAIPEPASLALIALTGTAMLGARRFFL